ncbi:hypothetical protein [Rhizobium laguerreae]|nr:hypothetical protein [Rhizobium laguerreae]
MQWIDGREAFTLKLRDDSFDPHGCALFADNGDGELFIRREEWEL